MEVDKDDLFSHPLPITEDLVVNGTSVNECWPYVQEYETLKHLTESNCSSAPRHIAHFRCDQNNPWVQGGFLCFVVMTEVPGMNVAKIWDYIPRTAEKRHEQTRIQEAFKKALV